jgi:hypothetical protein
LARKGLPHPARCVFCDQEQENIQHILTTCVLARDFWFKILSQFGLEAKEPKQREASFTEWWKRVIEGLSKNIMKDLNSVIILGAWTLWKHRNSVVFDKARPSIQALMRAFEEDYQLWCFVGAKNLKSLGQT